MREIAYAVCCGAGALLALTPLPWHFQIRSISILIYLGWVFIGCLNMCINAILWAGNVEDKAPIWCDISTRIIICLNVAIPMSGMLIQRRLYRIAVIKEIGESRKRELIINLLLGVGFPLLSLVFHYIVQPVRYFILEDIGCWPGSLSTILTTFMIAIWPVIIGLTSLVYSVLTIRAFIKARRQFTEVLNHSGTGINLSWFFRLMALALTDAICTLPMALYFLISNPLNNPLDKWVSWDWAHEDIGWVGVTTHEELVSDRSSKASLDLNRWVIPTCAFVFFLFFGLSGEATRQYQNVFWRIVAPLGFKRPEPKPRSVKVRWTKWFASSKTTTLQSLNGAVSCPTRTDQSKADLEDDLDEKREITVSTIDVQNLEFRSGRIEEDRKESIGSIV